MFVSADFPDCREVAIPFLCHYYFPIKQCTTGDVYTVTQEDCTQISNTVCRTPWNLAITLGYGDKIPNCDSLPPRSITSNNYGIIYVMYCYNYRQWK